MQVAAVMFQYDETSDGKRFLIAAVATAYPRPLMVGTNWTLG